MLLNSDLWMRYIRVIAEGVLLMLGLVVMNEYLMYCIVLLECVGGA